MHAGWLAAILNLLGMGGGNPNPTATEGRCICLFARPQQRVFSVMPESRNLIARPQEPLIERIFSALPESRNLNAKPQTRTFETDPGCEC